MATSTQFFGWWQPPSAAAVPAATPGAARRTRAVALTATDANDTTQTATRNVVFDLAGPGDVTGLTPAAIVRTYPAPGAANVEYDKAVYVELAAPDLPWRYTLDAPNARALRPWLVLLVGTTEEIVLSGGVAQVAAAVLADTPIASTPAGAHVERSSPGSAPIARLLSVRALVPDHEHCAIVVAGYTADGAPAWSSAAATLTVLHTWTFRTRAGGDFAVLARRLRPQDADSALGSARLTYRPLPTAEPMVISGALVAAAGAAGDPGPPDAAIRADVDALTAPLGDAAHPVLGLPQYDGSWPADLGAPADPPGWRAELRSDPRIRGIAGLGAQAGVQHQDLLAAASARLAGAYEETAERLRRLSLGLLTARSLWRRRMPADGARRLAVLGPGLRNVLAPGGPVAQVLTRGDRVLSQAMFSSAAKRAWRTAGAEQSPGHDTALRAAAVAPPQTARAATAIAHTDDLARAVHLPALDDTASRPAPRVSALVPRLKALTSTFDRSALDVTARQALDQHLGAVTQRVQGAQPVAILPLLHLLESPTRQRLDSVGLDRALATLDQAPDSDDLAELGERLTRRPVAPASDPIDIDSAAVAITAAFDPTSASPAMVDRVLDGIDDRVSTGGVADQPLAPHELLPTLRMPAWRFLRDEAPAWLLPGAGELPADSVVALATNPGFVDAFLLGLNAQVLSELRFRNAPILPGWTPLRSFWDRHDATGPLDDIADIGAWPTDSPFGSAAHRSAAAAGVDLVVLFNTALFREYPGTVVYLVPAAQAAGGGPDWRAEPSLTTPVFPTFQGQLAPEQVFFGFDVDPDVSRTHWVVLEETPQGRRFWNLAHPPTASAVVAAGDGAELARAAVTSPRRVLIRGDVLIRAGS
jgi:hypothetical protein